MAALTGIPKSRTAGPRRSYIFDTDPPAIPAARAGLSGLELVIVVGLGWYLLRSAKSSELLLLIVSALYFNRG